MEIYGVWFASWGGGIVPFSPTLYNNGGHTMKLYYSPGACSLAPHIALREAGVDVALEKVDLKAHVTSDGTDFYGINPKGYVPVVELKDGSVLTEGVAMMQYIADQHPHAKLAPANGTMERYRLQEWLNYITSELHKGIGAFFNPLLQGELAVAFKGNVTRRLKLVDDHLAKHGPFLMGKDFTIADAYLFTVLRWTGIPALKLDLSQFPAIVAFKEAVAKRPAVQAALAAEGISA
jgi:glutathione S-transferase